MLTNKALMHESNYAAGYNIYSGKKDISHPHNKLYGEIKTGKAGKKQDHIIVERTMNSCQ